MKLKEGDIAVPFKAEDIKGNQVHLTDYRDKPVLLSFFRDAACPFCNLRVHKLIKDYDRFLENGLEIVVLFSSGRKEMEKYVGKQNAPFVIIPNPEMDIYKAYGVNSSIAGMFKAMSRMNTMKEIFKKGFFSFKSTFDKHTLPADFLIDENQTIVKTHYGDDFGDHMDLDFIFTWSKNRENVENRI